MFRAKRLNCSHHDTIVDSEKILDCMVKLPAFIIQVTYQIRLNIRTCLARGRQSWRRSIPSHDLPVCVSCFFDYSKVLIVFVSGQSTKTTTFSKEMFLKSYAGENLKRIFPFCLAQCRTKEHIGCPTTFLNMDSVSITHCRQRTSTTKP